MKNIEKKIKDLTENINKWNYEYFINNNPTISDRVYDTNLKLLIELEKEYPNLVQSDSPTKKIGDFSLSKFSKVNHSKKMLSLNKAYAMSDIEKFVNNIEKKTNNNEQYWVEPKIDGLSISLKYKNGILVQASTRGDGEVGEDVTGNVFNIIDDIPTKIKYLSDIEFRGEIFSLLKNFEKINNMSGNIYANPRNFAAGTLRQISSKVVKDRNLSCIIYEIIDPLKHNLSSYVETNKFIQDNGFNFSKFGKLLSSTNEIHEFINDFDSIRKKIPYEIDGLVIKVNDISLYKLIGETTKFPKYNIAFKFDDEIVQTTIEDIFITIGRTGNVTYNAKLMPVLLKGSVITFATLHNFKYIDDLNLNIGDEINLKKAGEIIPKVISVFRKNNDNKFKKIQTCISCKSKLFDTKTNNGQFCPNKECDAQIVKSIIHFVSREGMDIKGFGEKWIEKFYDLGILRNIKDIYKISDHKNLIFTLEGWGEKSWENLLSSIEKSKENSLDKLIFSIGIHHLGARNAKLIAEEVVNINNLLNLNIDSLEDIRDLGPITIHSIKEFLLEEKNIDLIQFLINNNVSVKDYSKKKNDDIFSGLTFVITGKLKRERSYYKEIIESKGGTVSSSVSSKTNYLLSGKDPGSKYEKALKFNVKIIDENSFDIIKK